MISSLPKALGLLTLLALAACSSKTENASPEQTKALTDKLAKLQSQFDLELKAWRAKVRAMAATQQSTQGPCTIKANDYHRSITVRLPALDTLVPLHLKHIQSQLKHSHAMIDVHLQANRPVPLPNLESANERLGSGPIRKDELGYKVLLIDSERSPRLLDNKTYEPGFIKARLFLFDMVAKTFVCAGDASIESDKTTKVFTRATNKTLLRDLEIKTLFRSFKTLQALK